MRQRNISCQIGARKTILKRFIQGASGKTFLVVDGHPTHRSKMARKFVEENRERLQLFFLPPYSPELNPDERVWNDLKNNSVQKSPEIVRAYFSDRHVQYASC